MKILQVDSENDLDKFNGMLVPNTWTFRLRTFIFSQLFIAIIA